MFFFKNIPNVEWLKPFVPWRVNIQSQKTPPTHIWSHLIARNYPGGSCLQLCCETAYAILTCIPSTSPIRPSLPRNSMYPKDMSRSRHASIRPMVTREDHVAFTPAIPQGKKKAWMKSKKSKNIWVLTSNYNADLKKLLWFLQLIYR